MSQQLLSRYLSIYGHLVHKAKSFIVSEQSSPALSLAGCIFVWVTWYTLHRVASTTLH